MDDELKTAFGESIVAELHPQIQGTFEYTVDNTELIRTTLSNGGTVTQSDGMAVVGTSTTTASSALLKSKQHAKYRGELMSLLRFSAIFSDPEAGTTQLFGLADEVGSAQPFKNGYMIGYLGIVFGFHRFKNDTVITTPISEWNDSLDGVGNSRETIDQTKLGIWAIALKFLGGGAQYVLFEKSLDGTLRNVLTSSYSNENEDPSVFNPNFHFMMYASNGGTTSDKIIKSSSFAYFIQGRTSFIEVHYPQFSTGTKQKTNVTTEVAIFTIRNKATYASKTNFIDALMEFVTASIEASSANNLGDVRLVKNATLGGSPSYADINATDSIMEIDTAGTTVTGGVEAFPVQLAGKNDRVSENLLDLKIILNPGETLTLAGLSANSATIEGSALWKELF